MTDHSEPERVPADIPGLTDPARALFSISVAAELSGLHPQTLRAYEREGFLEPERSQGGTRRYSGDDIVRMRTIGVMTTAGLNMAGVRKVLELEREVEMLRAEVDTLRKRIDGPENA